MTTTKSAPRGRRPSTLAKNLRRLMREGGIRGVRELDRLSLVPAETLRNLLGGRTRAMTHSNVGRIADALSARLGRPITPEELRGGRQ